MAAPQSKTVVIVCPHCATRYQVPAETVGSKGRQVQCAHCGRAWQAFAEKVIEPRAPKPAPPPTVVARTPAKDPDQMFDAAAEAELDAEFEAEQKAAAEPPPPEPAAEQMRSIEEIKAAIAPKAPDPIAVTKPADAQADKKRQKAFDERQHMLTRQLPLARVRRMLRLTGLVTLALLIGCGFSFRTDIVRMFPDLAGTYEALGLGVNVVGLEFRDVKTLLALRRGADVMQVDARIYSVAPGPVEVPPVVVTLLSDDEQALYEWSVAPSVPTLAPGEVVDFSTQVTAPPAGATKVRLTFASGRVQVQSPIVAEPVPEEPVR
jgi:predicted Zn finger-like uncharacterized protein